MSSCRQPAPRGVLWEGASPLDRAPIVAIATMHRGTKDINRVTGPVVQVYILRQDVSPTDAVRSGLDRSICGYCPLRSRHGTKDRACYVNVGQAPWNIWRAYRAGKYARLFSVHDGALSFFTEPFSGRRIRWGAYGDPAMLPPELVRTLNGAATAHLGYTHQWRHEWARWTRGVFMASVETPEQELRARGRGWGTFRVGRRDHLDKGEATLCPAESAGVTCADCGVCDGRQVSVFISARGTGALWIPAERLVQKAKRPAEIVPIPRHDAPGPGHLSSTERVSRPAHAGPGQYMTTYLLFLPTNQQLAEQLVRMATCVLETQGEVNRRDLGAFSRGTRNVEPLVLVSLSVDASGDGHARARALQNVLRSTLASTGAKGGDLQVYVDAA